MCIRDSCWANPDGPHGKEHVHESVELEGAHADENREEALEHAFDARARAGEVACPPDVGAEESEKPEALRETGKDGCCAEKVRDALVTDLSGEDEIQTDSHDEAVENQGPGRSRPEASVHLEHARQRCRDADQRHEGEHEHDELIAQDLSLIHISEPTRLLSI